MEAEKKINDLQGSFVGTDMFFNFTFLQERYGKVSQEIQFTLGTCKKLVVKLETIGKKFPPLCFLFNPNHPKKCDLYEFLEKTLQECSERKETSTDFSSLEL